MRIKYSPIKWNPYAKLDVFPDTEIQYINENSIKIDGVLFEFDPESVEWPDIFEQTNEIIIEAKRDESNELLLEIRRFFTESREWDTGDYHVINR